MSPQPTPIQTLLGCVRTLLADIVAANGYWTDAGADAQVGGEQILDDSNTGCAVAVVWEKSSRAPEGLHLSHRQVQFGVLIKCPASVLDAHQQTLKVADDVEKALRDRQRSYPAGFRHPEFIESGPIRSEDAAGWVGVLAHYTSVIPITTKGTTP